MLLCYCVLSSSWERCSVLSDPRLTFEPKIEFYSKTRVHFFKRQIRLFYSKFIGIESKASLLPEICHYYKYEHKLSDIRVDVVMRSFRTDVRVISAEFAVREYATLNANHCSLSESNLISRDSRAVRPNSQSFAQYPQNQRISCISFIYLFIGFSRIRL